LRRDIQQLGGVFLADQTNLRQICRRFQVRSFALPHIRQPRRNHGALAFVQVATAEATLSRDTPVNFSEVFDFLPGAVFPLV
jgi:hypothetical protein